MIDPTIIVKANHNRQVVTIRSTAISSPDWVDIVGSRLDLAHDAGFTDIFDTQTTTHYKVRGYIEYPDSPAKPNTEVYGRVTLTKNDNTTLQKVFHFTVPMPVLGTVKDDDGTKYVVEMMKMDKDGNWSERFAGTNVVVAGSQAAHIDIVADATGEMVIYNKWTTPILVQNITQELEQVEVARGGNVTVAVDDGDTVVVTEGTPNATFRTWDTRTQPLCKNVSAHVSYMPNMNRFTADTGGYVIPNCLFYQFNCGGTITSFPEGSFDTHRLRYGVQETVMGPFYAFNSDGALTSLPEGSFDISNIRSTKERLRVPGYSAYVYSPVLHEGFYNFASSSALTSLPEGSFDTDNIQYFQVGMLNSFWSGTAITSLPEGSFGFSSLVGTMPALRSCNYNGLVTTLPAGSFHFPEGTICTTQYAFNGFNRNGALTSLPEHSFNFLIGDARESFNEFNRSGQLTSLPAGSFRFSPQAQTATYRMFWAFNQSGALTSLPAGSFNTNAITTLEAQAFQQFNDYGALVSLPVGSFNFDNVTTAPGTAVFNYFNQHGSLKTLPKGSFGFANLTLIGGSFAQYFNSSGDLEYLPVRSFSSNAIVTASQSTGMSYQAFYAFNSGGKLTKSEFNYNPNFIFPTPSSAVSIDAYYYREGQTQLVETVSRGNQFKYYAADYFDVEYQTSQSYTTNLEHQYLSGTTVIFTAVSTDPDYIVQPGITTEGGQTVTVTDNGDDTFTFVMPEDNIDVSFTLVRKAAKIVIVPDEAGTIRITNLWTSSITIAHDSNTYTVGTSSYREFAVAANDSITITEGTRGVTFRNWKILPLDSSDRFYGLATKVSCHVEEIATINNFTTDASGTTAGDNFFARFCTSNVLYDVEGGAPRIGKGITSLPADSFDLSGITTVGNNFCFGFNYGGKLTSLPTGSFDTSNITTLGNDFFSYFNWCGALTSLPAGSFDTSNIANNVGDGFFQMFNATGALTALPAGSFDISGITTTGKNFFTDFNGSAYYGDGGKLTSLPTGSFDTSNITTIDNLFFAGFNEYGKLTSLPVGSFNTSSIVSSNINILSVFSYFNHNGKLTSLPAGSFDLSGFTRCGHSFFHGFNYFGELTSLPADSFDISNVTYAHSYFFAYFNQNGKLTSLPAGSFDTSSIATVGGNFFANFNQNGELTSLPAGSFDISGVDSSAVSPDHFFTSFNQNGKLTSLPAGSFDTSNITNVSSYFFSSFNQNGKLTSLPVDSFDTSNIASVGSSFFSYFNDNGKLTSLPANSFDISSITNANSYFFYEFNHYGELTSLPAGSFDTSSITTAGTYFFSYFNEHGELTSLPTDSFVTSNITTAGNDFFGNFNQNGKLTSLPVGSFDISSITSAGNNFFSYFNEHGELTSLPDGSFDMDSITSAGNNFCRSFNSSGMLTALPAGSFSIGNITTVGNYFFSEFNYSGSIQRLPSGSFDTSSITTAGTYFFAAFNRLGWMTSLPTHAFTMTGITSIGGNAFYNFNNQGKLSKNNSAYNANFVFPSASSSSSVTAHYWDYQSGGSTTPGSLTQTTETINRGDAFKYWQW